MDPEENEMGVEQTDGIKKKQMYNRVKEEVSRRMNIITRTELNDKNLLEAISTKVNTVAAYSLSNECL